MVYAAQTEKAQPSSSDRYDWWLVASSDEAACLTADLKTAPKELLVQTSSKYCVGLAEGNLWRINLEDNSFENITKKLSK